MRYLALLLIFFAFPVVANAQDCYGGAYAPQQQAFAAPLATNYCSGVQTTIHTVTLQIPVQTVVQMPVAAPQVLAVPQCQSQVGVAYGGAYGGSAGFQTFGVPIQQFGFQGSYGVGLNQGFNQQFRGNFNQGFNQNFGGQRFGVVNGGNGISVSARDRRGTQVVANGNNQVRIERDLLGRIKGARADSNKGLLGRISPF